MKYSRLVIAFSGLLLSLACAAPAFASSVQLQDGRWLETSTGAIGNTEAEAQAHAASMPVVTEGSRPLTISDAPVSATTTVETPPPSFGLRDAITRARTMLEAHLVATKPKTPKTVTSTNTWVDVTLAVWNATSNEVRLVDVQKNGARVREADEADIAVARTNGINSEFVFDKGKTDDYVVAIEYPIFTEKWLTKKKKVYQLSDVVYVPYSEKLQVPEMVAWGKATLDGYVADVLSELRDKGIKSRAFPNRLLADVIDPALLKAIVFIEHSGINTMVNDPVGTTSAIQVVLAANQGSAYNYSVSTAGARGLVQFIPSTYKLIARRTDVGLIPDFVAGMSDPHNAIKAEVTYLDAELANMPADIRALTDTDQTKLDAYLAAAYNGGGGRVHKAIKALGENWASDPSALTASLQREYDTLWNQADSLKKKILAEDDPKIWKPMQTKLNASRAARAKVSAQIATLKSSSLRSETAGYIKKLNAVLAILKPDNTSVAMK